MKWTDKLARIMAACAVLALLAAAKPANAGSLSADTIALFPKNVGEFAYADLKQARTMKWFPALQEQMLPERFKQFEKFLASAGVDPNTTVEELAWGLVGQSAAKQEGKATVAADVPESEEIVGIALGNFNPDSTEAYFKQQKLATSKSRGYTLFAFGSGVGPSDLFFFFIDSSKAAFGHKQLLEKMIEIRYGGEEGLLANDKLFSLINEVNGSGVVWAVLDASYTRLAMSQLAPEVQQFPEAAKLVQNMQSMIISATASSGLEAKFQAVCGAPEDANTLSQLMTAGLLYKKYQASKDNPELGQLLDQASVTPSGERVVIRLSVSDDQMTSLIKRNTFSFKM
ncbi:MAG TPA: hypothetical protein VFB10_13965 [Candidatus Dormibacteraeota bacterium]|nr:hypothetical protein [Candidatus Dormibacteraeota bacterium]